MIANIGRKPFFFACQYTYKFPACYSRYSTRQRAYNLAPPGRAFSVASPSKLLHNAAGIRQAIETIRSSLATSRVRTVAAPSVWKQSISLTRGRKICHLHPKRFWSRRVVSRQNYYIKQREPDRQSKQSRARLQPLGGVSSGILWRSEAKRRSRWHACLTFADHRKEHGRAI